MDLRVIRVEYQGAPCFMCCNTCSLTMCCLTHGQSEFLATSYSQLSADVKTSRSHMTAFSGAQLFCLMTAVTGAHLICQNHSCQWHKVAVRFCPEFQNVATRGSGSSRQNCSPPALFGIWNMPEENKLAQCTSWLVESISYIITIY